MKAWDFYLHQLESSPTIGRELTEAELLKLSPDQRLQLEKLKEEALKPE
jgi:hypothetical protein